MGFPNGQLIHGWCLDKNVKFIVSLNVLSDFMMQRVSICFNVMAGLGSWSQARQ